MLAGEKVRRSGIYSRGCIAVMSAAGDVLSM